MESDGVLSSFHFNVFRISLKIRASYAPPITEAYGLRFTWSGRGENSTQEPRSRLVLTIDKPAGAVGVMESPMRGLPAKTSETKAERLQSAATLHHENLGIPRFFLFHGWLDVVR